MRTRSRFRFTLSTLAAALMMLSGASASRADLLYTGSSGGYSAAADFSLSGNTLTVTLTNTSTSSVRANGDTLGGLFFNTTTALTAVSAALNTASFTDTNNVVHNGSFVARGSIVNNVGEGWLYGHPSSGSGYNSTIAAAGYTMGFNDGAAQAFYSNPVTPLDGADYALVGLGGIVNPNGGLKSPLFENSLVFTLTVGNGFSLSELGNTVRFQMGTSLTETSFTGTLAAVPEPSTMAIAALGALGFIGYGLRRRSAK
jgi:hypothetical protein